MSRCVVCDRDDMDVVLGNHKCSKRSIQAHDRADRKAIMRDELDTDEPRDDIDRLNEGLEVFDTRMM